MKKQYYDIVRPLTEPAKAKPPLQQGLGRCRPPFYKGIEVVEAVEEWGEKEELGHEKERKN